MKIDFKKLIYAASLAPSPDNNSPWRFESVDNRLIITLHDQLSFKPDVRRSLDYISLGAVIENIILEAEAQGFFTRVSYNKRPTGKYEASLQFSISKPKQNPLYPALFTRRTDRSFYKNQPLPDEFLRDVQLVSYDDSLKLHMFNSKSGAKDMKFWANMMAQFEQIRFSSFIFHEHLFQVLRFSLAEIEKFRTGLYIKSLQLPPFAATLLKLMRSWKFTKFFNHFGLSKMLSKSTYLQMRFAGGVGVITGNIHDTKNLIEAGRLMQKVWLTAEKHKLSVHPQGHLSVFYQMQNSNELSEQEKQIAQNAMRSCREKLNLSSDARAPLFIFRIGKGSGNTTLNIRSNSLDAKFWHQGSESTLDV